MLREERPLLNSSQRSLVNESSLNIEAPARPCVEANKCPLNSVKSDTSGAVPDEGSDIPRDMSSHVAPPSKLL